MRKIALLLVAFFVLSIFAGCSQKALTLVEMPGDELVYDITQGEATAAKAAEIVARQSTRPVAKLISKEYTISALSRIIHHQNANGTSQSGVRYTILSLEGFYGVEALRRTENGEYYVAYQVYGGGYCFVFLRDMLGDGAALCVTHALYISDTLNKTAIRNIQTGDSRAAVEAADPATTVNRAPETGKCSLHWVDNEIFIFTYDESGETVTGVEHYPDGRVPSSVDGWYFDYNLLPVDCR